MTSAISPDLLLNVLAKTICDEMKAASVCNQLSSTAQIASVDCASTTAATQLTAIRSGSSCQAAILLNDPNQITICNPCSVTNSNEVAVISLTLNCGSNIYEPALSKFNVYMQSLANPTANHQVATAVNNIATLIQNSNIQSTITQGVPLIQNITVNTATGPINAAYYTATIDLVSNAVSIIPGMQDAFNQLLSAINAPRVTTIQKTATPATATTIIPVVTSVPHMSIPTPTPSHVFILPNYIWLFITFILIAIIISIVIKKRNQSQNTLPQLLVSTRIK